MNKVILIIFLLSFTFAATSQKGAERKIKKSSNVDSNVVSGESDVSLQKHAKGYRDRVIKDMEQAPVNLLDKKVEELKKVGEIKTYDSNNDKEIDIWEYYRFHESLANTELEADQKRELLIRQDIDVNFDGKIDVVKQFHNGSLVRVLYDFDFDGKFDTIHFYRDGKIVLKEFDFLSNGKTDVWKFYRDNRLFLKEVDRNGDGIVDMWVYFKDEKIIRIGQDTKGDGSPDLWTK